jgi:quinoprotein glucose dehydrogenase
MKTILSLIRHLFVTANFFIFGVIILSGLAGCQQNNPVKYTTWEVYRGDDGTNAYSQLDQINTKNINQLKVAWIYRTGDPSENTTLECNPIIIDDVLFGVSPKLKAFALNAKTGAVRWAFDPFSKDSKEGGISRGLTYWRSGKDQRIFLFASNKLIALDATTGKQIMDFGENGYVDLNKDLRGKEGIALHEDVKNSSPGVIYKDLIICGSLVGENYESSPGHIRAYDVRTGKKKWIFRTIPEPGEFGYNTWQKDSYKTVGGCNSWSGLSIDTKRGIVFAATGTPAFDFHGGERTGQNLFGNSVIALSAATGKLIWYFQISHHDLWDYDLPSPPNLVTIKKGNKKVDAVAQITKQGFIFLFDRETGAPLFPIEEKPVAISKMPGEQSWSTQPFPSRPLPLSRQKFDESIITDISPQAHDFVLKEVKKYSWGDLYLPPTLDGIIQMPGFRGGAEWSGACVDMETGIMYVGTNDIPNIVQLEPVGNDVDLFENLSMQKAGNLLYMRNCSACHGEDLKGNGQFPPLFQIGQRLKPVEVENVVEKGRAMMPSFSRLSDEERNAIISYLFKINRDKKYKNTMAGNIAISEQKTRTRYRIKGYSQLLDQDGYPGVKPPWGTLNAVDLNSGDILWKVPLGQYPELAEKGKIATGTQLFGGGIVTAGRLIFIGASKDEKFRAIDKTSGKLLWEYQLPAGGYATPATYQVDGKQYVVIAAGGGGKQHTKSADYYIAFTLP